MFRKTENLFNNYKKYYTLGDQLQQINGAGQECIYENSAKTRNSFFSQMSKNQKNEIRCFECVENNFSNFPPVNCRLCKNIICNSCVQLCACKVCEFSVCKNCRTELQINGFYDQYCFDCAANLS